MLQSQILEEQLKQLLQDKNDIGLKKLRDFGIKHGFLNNYYRRNIWKQLLQFKTNSKHYQWLQPNIKSPQYDQIQKDVNRSMNSLDVCLTLEGYKQTLRDQLSDVLDQLYVDLPGYIYYQGYHDIVTIFMFVLGTDDGYYASKQAAILFFKDYNVQSFEFSVIPQLNIIHRLLKEYATLTNDGQLVQIFEVVQQITFPVPWLLTWFSHSLKSFSDIVRVWDFLLCSDPKTILYLCCAIIIYHKKNFQINDYTDYGEILTTLQFYFQNLHEKETNIEEVLSLTSQIQTAIPLQEFLKNKSMKIDDLSLMHHRNFISQIQYLKDYDQEQKRLSIKVQNYIKYSNINKFLYQVAGVAISYALNQYLLQ